MKISFELQLPTILRWLVGLLFVWAALGKLANLQEFYASLLAYQLPLPSFILQLAAVTLPWLELLCGLMLLGRLWFNAAVLWVAAMSVVFIIATGQAWVRGLQISCGCLDLSLIGITKSSQAGQVLSSVGFAFLRAALLLVAAAYLLMNHVGDHKKHIAEADHASGDDTGPEEAIEISG